MSRHGLLLFLGLTLFASLTATADARQRRLLLAQNGQVVQEPEALPEPRASAPVQAVPQYGIAQQPSATQKGLVTQKAFGPSQRHAGQKLAYPHVVHQPRISYRQHHRCHRRCSCHVGPPVKAVLPVMNPVTCCVVEIPVCLPSCCMGPPLKGARPALFKRSIVAYQWPSGFRVKVVFDRFGDAVVHYYGS